MTIKYSVEEYNIEGVGIKYDDKKPKMHLLPPKAITEVSKVLTFGADKYDEENWRKLDNLQARYSSSALRHIFAHLDGEQLDPESGVSHLAHAICCLMFKLEVELETKEEKTRKLIRNKSTEGSRSAGEDASSDQERSLRDFEYRVQYKPSDPTSGGL